nr:MAG: putative replisome organizer protein [Bacteriophage sp.]
MLPNWAVDDDRLGGYDLLVYMALIRHADNTGVCWPSLERLAKIARCSQPTASKSLNVLEQLGYIRRVKSDGRANRYHVSLWKPTPKQGYDHAPTPKPAFDHAPTPKPAFDPEPTPKPAFDPPKPAFDPPQNEVLTNNTQENKTQEQYSRDKEKITVTCHSVDTLKSLMDLWPKKCRVSNEFLMYFNTAYDEVGANTLMRAAKRFVESCEGTPLQYVRTLPMWLANSVNWRAQKPEQRSEAKLTNWMAHRLPDSMSADVATVLRARRAYWGVTGGVEALEMEFFPDEVKNVGNLQQEPTV